MATVAANFANKTADRANTAEHGGESKPASFQPGRLYFHYVWLTILEQT